MAKQKFPSARSSLPPGTTGLTGEEHDASASAPHEQASSELRALARRLRGSGWLIRREQSFAEFDEALEPLLVCFGRAELLGGQEVAVEEHAGEHVDEEVGVGWVGDLSMGGRLAKALDCAFAAWHHAALPVAAVKSGSVGQPPKPELDGAMFDRRGEASDRNAQAVSHVNPKRL